MTALARLLFFVAPAAAHISLWHPSSYGFFPADRQNGDNAVPLHALPFDKWWFHGYMDKPPIEGWFLDLPAGGTLHAEVACNKQLTTWGLNWEMGGHACQRAHPETDTGMEHTPDPYSTPIDKLKNVKGCAIAIAYESDPHKIKPEDFVVVTTNFSCPWFKDVDFKIPAGLPECPEGGCHCMWAWNHSPAGGGQEMFANWLRCKVSGLTGNTPLPKPQVARKCPFDRNNCTVGAKQPLYWDQLEGNNIHQDVIDPPYYNQEYGFLNGAQTDLWETGCDEYHATTVMVEPYWMTTTATWLTTTPASCTPTPTTPPYRQVRATDVWATKPYGETFLDTMAPKPTTDSPPGGGVLVAQPTTQVVPAGHSTSDSSPAATSTAYPSVLTSATLSTDPSATDGSATSNAPPAPIVTSPTTDVPILAVPTAPTVTPNSPATASTAAPKKCNTKRGNKKRRLSNKD